MLVVASGQGVGFPFTPHLGFQNVIVGQAFLVVTGRRRLEHSIRSGPDNDLSSRDIIAKSHNLLVVRASDLLVGVSGGYGTLSEIALALKTGKPVIGLETWRAIEGVTYVSSPQGAMEAAVRLLKLRE